VKTRPAGQLEQRLLVLVTLGLVAFGLVMVFSATSASAALGAGDPMTFLVKQGAYAFAGLLLLALASRFDYHRLRALAPMMLVGSLFLCIAVLVVAPPINGAQRWFLVGPISVQPSELAKIAVCVWTCALLARRPTPRTMGELMKPLGLVVGFFCILILLEPDLGTAVTVLMIAAAMVFAAGLNYTYLLGLLLTAAPAAYLVIATSEYRMKRVTAFLDPYSDPLGDGYQMIQSMIAVGTGGITGRGLMDGLQKLFYLPEPHNDFIFSVIGEELGLIGATVVVACFCVITWRGLRTAMRAPDRFGSFVAIGLTTMIAFQAFFNISVVLGLLPTKGIPLPFVSAGGSSLLINMIGMAVLLNVSQHGSPTRVVTMAMPPADA
jgi:cell division protein FtsW